MMLTGNLLSVKTIQALLFNGMPKIFLLFWTKFKAFVRMKSFQMALKECHLRKRKWKKEAIQIKHVTKILMQ